jgi:hypothetical protein
MNSLQDNFKVKYTLSQALAIHTFTMAFIDLRKVNEYDCAGKLVKASILAVQKRLRRQLATHRKAYNINLPAHEALAICVAAQVQTMPGVYERVVLAELVTNIQKFYL